MTKEYFKLEGKKFDLGLSFGFVLGLMLHALFVPYPI